MQKGLRTNLEERFGALPEDLARRIAAITDAERIQACIRQSLHIQSLSDLKL